MDWIHYVRGKNGYSIVRRKKYQRCCANLCQRTHQLRIRSYFLTSYYLSSSIFSNYSNKMPLKKFRGKILNEKSFWVSLLKIKVQFQFYLAQLFYLLVRFRAAIWPCLVSHYLPQALYNFHLIRVPQNSLNNVKQTSVPWIPGLHCKA